MTGPDALSGALRAAICVAAVAAVSACGGGRKDSHIFQDTHPLPEEPMVVPTKSIGTYGGRFVVTETAGPKTFNGIMGIEASSTDITFQTFVGLTGYDNEAQQITPGLAKSWELGPDGLTWTFHLRKGAAFSDGHPITSDDVLFTFSMYYDDALHPASQDFFVMNGKKWIVTAPDPFTVVVKTPGPNALVPELVNYNTFAIMPKHVLQSTYKSGGFASAYSVSTPPESIITSGPWRIQQYVPGDKTVLARNPYWFGVDSENHRLPYLNELVYLIVPDQDAADLKFRSGEVDGLLFTSVKPANYRWYEEHQQAGNFTLYNLGPALTTNFFWFNLNKVRKPVPGKKLGDSYVDPVKYAWFNNPVFRRAISLAVDRDAMIASIFFGDAAKNWSQQTPGDKVWYSPDVVKYDYHLDEAKKLIATFHWSDKNDDGFLEDASGNTIGFSLKTNSGNNMRVSMANFIRDDLAKIGIKVTLVPVDFNTLITNLTDDFQYEAALLGLQSGIPPDPAQGQNVFRSSGQQHFWNIRQPKPETKEEARIDSLMDVIVSEPDLDMRKAAWKEMENMMNEQCWFIWLPTLNVKLPLRNRFGNVQPSVIPLYLIWNIDRVYLKTSGGQS